MVDVKVCMKEIEVLDMNFQKFIEIKMLNLFKINPLSANPTKWSNTLKQYVDNSVFDHLSVSDHFVGLALKGLKRGQKRGLGF